MVNQVNKGQQQGINYANTAQKKLDVDKQTTAATSQNQTSSVKAATDSVSITPQAQQLKNLHEKAELTSGFDSKKVSELKKAISEGNYQVDAEKLARSISEFEFNLYG